MDNGIDFTSAPKAVKINDPKEPSADTEKPPVPSPSDSKAGAAGEGKANAIPEQRSVRKVRGGEGRGRGGLVRVGDDGEELGGEGVMWRKWGGRGRGGIGLIGVVGEGEG